MRIKSILFALLLLALTSVGNTVTVSRAQGGIGNMPREDLYMLSALTRDSLSDELLAKIELLRGFASSNKIDSACMFIAYNGVPNKEGKWAKAMSVSDSAQRMRVSMLLTRLNTLYAGSPVVHREYFAAFKDKDNPSGMMLLYQIKYTSGKSSKMISYRFYPVGDLLMLGEIQ